MSFWFISKQHLGEAAPSLHTPIGVSPPVRAGLGSCPHTPQSPAPAPSTAVCTLPTFLLSRDKGIHYPQAFESPPIPKGISEASAELLNVEIFASARKLHSQEGLLMSELCEIFCYCIDHFDLKSGNIYLMKYSFEFKALVFLF